MRYLIVVCFLELFLFGHKLNLFVIEEKDTIVVNAYFASSAPCKGCKVEIFDAYEKLVHSSHTNGKGEYAFEKKQKNYTIKVEALGGHAAITTYEANGHEHASTPKSTNTYLQTFLALMGLAVIFLFLKRVKK